MLADAGIPLGNQSVLMKGINDCGRVMKRLVHGLVQIRVKPYYYYQCDLAEGTRALPHLGRQGHRDLREPARAHDRLRRADLHHRRHRRRREDAGASRTYLISQAEPPGDPAQLRRHHLAVHGAGRLRVGLPLRGLCGRARAARRGAVVRHARADARRTCGRRAGRRSRTARPSWPTSTRSRSQAWRATDARASRGVVSQANWPEHVALATTDGDRQEADVAKVFIEPVGVTLEVARSRTCSPRSSPPGSPSPAIAPVAAPAPSVSCAWGPASSREVDRGRGAEAVAAAARRRLAPRLPGAPGVGARQRRGAPDRRPASYPHDVEAAPRQGEAGRQPPAGRAAAGHARGQARRPGAPAGRPASPAATAGRRPSVRPASCPTSCGDTAGARRSRRTTGASSTPSRPRCRRSPTAPPSTSAPRRSSSTSSTSRPAGSSTRRRSRTRRCVTARTSSRASPAPSTRDGAPSSPTPCATASTRSSGELCERNGVDPRHIYDMTVVGNTAMHHLALGLSPVGLGPSPFAPAVAAPLTLRAGELGLAMNPEGGVHFPPPIAGFVGSDALAVVAATRLASKRRPCLALDIGTNTEIAIAHDGRVTVDELRVGAGLRGLSDRPRHEGRRRGHRAGAHRPRRRADRGHDHRQLAPRSGCAARASSTCSRGLVASGVVDRTGRMQPHARVRQGERGLEYLLTDGPSGPIVFTQHDVRALQLAKGAIASGWVLLLENLGLEPGDLHRVYVAGAFGNYLDVGAALRLDLLPPVPRDRVSFVGNAAGVGAQMALIDVRARRRMAALRARVEFLDLGDRRALQRRLHAAVAVCPRAETSTGAPRRRRGARGGPERRRPRPELRRRLGTAAGAPVAGAATSRSAAPRSSTARSAPWSATRPCRRACSSWCAWRSPRVAVGAVVLPRGLLRELRRPGVPVRVLGISATLAANLLLYFLAIRATGVSVAIFLSYLAPVYLAVVAPLVFDERTEGAVLRRPRRRPRRHGADPRARARRGPALHPRAALRLGCRGHVRGVPAVRQVAAAPARAEQRRSSSCRARSPRSWSCRSASTRSSAATRRPPPTWSWACLLGVVTTAFTFSLFMHGLRHIKVQHAPIMGYLEPVSAPLYALVFLGERPGPWTLAGGALIIVSGLLVVAFGGETQPELQG